MPAPTFTITPKRRAQIFATGLIPLLVLYFILAMASRFGLDLVSFFTHVEKRDAANYEVVTKVLGVPIKSRPATQEDIAKDDEAATIVKIVVLVGSSLIIAVSFLMCYASVTGRPTGALRWFDQKLGSVRWSWQRPNA